MNINRPTPLIARPARESSIANARSQNNARTSNPSVSENSAAASSRSAQPGCAAVFQKFSLVQTHLLNRAKSAIKKNPQEFLCKFHESNLTKKSRNELARFVAKEAPYALAEHIQNFEIPDEGVRIELARLVAKEAPEALAEHIQDFEISDGDVRIELACFLITETYY